MTSCRLCSEAAVTSLALTWELVSAAKAAGTPATPLRPMVAEAKNAQVRLVREGVDIRCLLGFCDCGVRIKSSPISLCLCNLMPRVTCA